MPPRLRRERVHLLEAPHPRRPGVLRRPAVVVADPDAEPWVELAQLVVDRILGHRRQGPENVPRAAWRATLVSEHPGNQLAGMAAAQVAHVPVAEWQPLELDVEHVPDPSGVGPVGPL